LRVGAYKPIVVNKLDGWYVLRVQRIINRGRDQWEHILHNGDSGTPLPEKSLHLPPGSEREKGLYSHEDFVLKSGIEDLGVVTRIDLDLLINPPQQPQQVLKNATLSSRLFIVIMDEQKPQLKILIVLNCRVANQSWPSERYFKVPEQNSLQPECSRLPLEHIGSFGSRWLVIQYYILYIILFTGGGPECAPDSPDKRSRLTALSLLSLWEASTQRSDKRPNLNKMVGVELFHLVQPTEKKSIFFGTVLDAT
jgi:hypothetical protein